MITIKIKNVDNFVQKFTATEYFNKIIKKVKGDIEHFYGKKFSNTNINVFFKQDITEINYNISNYLVRFLFPLPIKRSYNFYITDDIKDLIDNIQYNYFDWIIKHELAHVLLFDIVEPASNWFSIPVWFTEGSAYYIETNSWGDNVKDLIRKNNEKCLLYNNTKIIFDSSKRLYGTQYVAGAIAIAFIYKQYSLTGIHKIVDQLSKGHSFPNAVSISLNVNYKNFLNDLINKCLSTYKLWWPKFDFKSSTSNFSAGLPKPKMSSNDFIKTMHGRMLNKKFWKGWDPKLNKANVNTIINKNNWQYIVTNGKDPKKCTALFEKIIDKYTLKLGIENPNINGYALYNNAKIIGSDISVMINKYNIVK